MLSWNRKQRSVHPRTPVPVMCRRSIRYKERDQVSLSSKTLSHPPKNTSLTFMEVGRWSGMIEIIIRSRKATLN